MSDVDGNRWANPDARGSFIILTHVYYIKEAQRNTSRSPIS